MRKHLYKFDQNYRTLTNDMDPIPSTSKQAEITIQFFTSGSDGKFMVIEVNEQSQIKTIKKIIAEKWKIPPENQLYKNKSDLKVMKDSDTVYGLEYLILEQIKEESDANTSDEIDEIPSSGSEKRMKLEEEERNDASKSSEEARTETSSTIDSLSCTYSYSKLIESVTESDEGVENISEDKSSS